MTLRRGARSWVLLALFAAGAFWLADWAVGTFVTLALCVTGLIFFVVHPSDDADAL